MATCVRLVFVASLYLLAGGQVHSEVINSDRLVSAFQNSFFVLNLQQLNSTVKDVQFKLTKLTSNNQVSDLKRARKILITIVDQVIDLFNKHNFALTKLATDKTIPTKDLFGQHKRTLKRLKKYISKDYAEHTEKMKEIMGCPVANEVESNLRHMNQQIVHLGSIIKRLKHLAFGTLNVSSNATTENEGRMAQTVNVLATNVLNLKSSITRFATTVDDAVGAIETANTFVSQMFNTGNNTLKGVNTARVGIRTTMNAAKMKTLSKFQETQQGVRKDLGGAILKLTEFFTSKKLLLLSREFDNSYHSFYLFLRNRSKSTASSIKNNFQLMAEHLDYIVSESSKMFFGAMLRTTLKLTDIVLERSSAADTCFKSHSTSLTMFYQAFTTLLQSCFNRETPRWTTLSNAVDIFGNLLRLNSNELSANIERCVTYTKFASSTADYVQAKYCMKTNLEDLNALDAILEPQFEQLNSLVDPQVEAVKYRLENCFASGSHELLALLRNTRAVMDVCAGRIEGCPRRNREDRNAERLERERD